LLAKIGRSAQWYSVVKFSTLESSQFLKEVIMEMAILVIGVGAVALWFFMTKDGGRKE
jgi:hypothetical protein